MKKFSFLILLIPFWFGAWFSPRTNTNQIASQDVLASSSDSHNVGASNDVWKGGYFSYQRMSYHADKPVVIASFGSIFASTDKNIYYVDDTGTTTRLN